MHYCNVNKIIIIGMLIIYNIINNYIHLYIILTIKEEKCDVEFINKWVNIWSWEENSLVTINGDTVFTPRSS